jgi:hypothetical protein
MKKQKWKTAAKYWEGVAREREAMIIAYPNDRKRFAERYAADMKTQLEQNEKIREAIGNQLSDMCVMHDSVLLKFERLQADHDKLQQAYERLHAEHMQAQADANQAQEIIERLRVNLELKMGALEAAREHSRIIEEDRDTMARHLAAALKAQEAAENQVAIIKEPQSTALETHILNALHSMVDNGRTYTTRMPKEPKALNAQEAAE